MVSFCLGCPLSASVPYVPGTGVAKVHQHWGESASVAFLLQEGGGAEIKHISAFMPEILLIPFGWGGGGGSRAPFKDAPPT